MLYVWGIVGIIAAIAGTVLIGCMFYKKETDKQRNKEIICAASGHDLESCVCKRCGKEEHDWDGCVCKRCNKKRDEGHKWLRCICAHCGKTRDEQHDWEKSDECGAACRICGKLKEDDDECDHEWEKSVYADAEMICKKCGKEQ